MRSASPNLPSQAQLALQHFFADLKTLANDTNVFLESANTRKADHSSRGALMTTIPEPRNGQFSPHFMAKHTAGRAAGREAWSPRTRGRQACDSNRRLSPLNCLNALSVVTS